MIIDNELFRSYSICKYKGLLKYIGKNRIISDFDAFQRQKEIEYRAKVIKEIEKKKREEDVLKMKFADNIDLQTEKNFLLGIKIKHKNIHVYIDALDKVRGKSSLGSFSYIPYIFVPKNKVGKQETLFLAFIAYVLGMVEERVIRHGVIIYGVYLKKRKVDLIKYQDTLACLIEQISGLSKTDQQPRLMLNKHCTICEFQKICEKEAREKDDLSLLRGMKGKEIETQISKGIFTVTQYSYTFRPRKRREKATNPSKRRHHALQALAIREQKIFIFGEPNIPTSPVSIYMDIETDPYRDFVYLIGLIIDSDDGMQTYSFWADSQAEEKLIVEQFLNVIKNYDKFFLFHYGSIETKYINYLNKSYTGKYKGIIDILIKKFCKCIIPYL